MGTRKNTLTWEDHRDRGNLAGAIVFCLTTTLSGIGVLAVAIWLYMDSAVYLSGTPKSEMYFTAIYIIMAAGGVMTIVGFLGCCGALRESQCMLGTYFVLLLVIFAAELTGGVWAYLHKDETRLMIAAHVKTLVHEQYGNDPIATKTVDALQRDLKCCGVDSPGDWSRVKTGLGNIVDVGISLLSSELQTYTVPKSCCATNDENLCETMRKIVVSRHIFKGLHTQGCSQKLEEYMEGHLGIVIGVVIGLAIAQLLALIFSIILCCGIRDSEGNSYKA